MVELSRRGFLGALAAASTSYFFYGSGLWRPQYEWARGYPPFDVGTGNREDLLDIITNISPWHLTRLVDQPLELTRILEDRHGNEFAQQLQQVPHEPLPEGEFSQLGYRIGEGNGGPRKVWDEFGKSFARRRQLPLITE